MAVVAATAVVTCRWPARSWTTSTHGCEAIHFVCRSKLSGPSWITFGEAKDAVQPMIDQARQFMRDRPFAAAALGGVVGFALLNTLRGK